ncbi:MAG: ATP-grasp domain-containing protein [Halioglobus sp.]
MPDTSPAVLVTACSGADDAALSVIRALGRAGIAVDVLAEDHRSLTIHSRYTQQYFVLPGFTHEAEEALAFMRTYASKQTLTPVLFPTADTDLLLLSNNRQELEDCFHLIAPPQDLVTALSDKALFSKLATELELPVPRTMTAHDIVDIGVTCQEIDYPVLLKPSHPDIWRSPDAPGLLLNKKALRVDAPEQLMEVYEKLHELDPNLVIQELVPGPDEEHFDIHVYMDKQGRPINYFTGQKLRIEPPYAGSGCFVKSRKIPEIAEISLAFLKAMNYTGLANINFKRHSQTGKYYLLEINPRVSQWNILATECGINLALIAYQDATGQAMEGEGVEQETAGRYYLSFHRDWRAFLEYHRNRDWSWREYLCSLFQTKMVYQVFSRDDFVPMVRQIEHSFKACLQYARKSLRIFG